MVIGVAPSAAAYEDLLPPLAAQENQFQANTLTEDTKRHMHFSVQTRNLDISSDRGVLGKGYREPVSSPAQTLARAAAAGAWRMMLSAEHMDRLYAGNGVDLQLPALGNMRLNFRSGDDSATAWPIAHGWSLGGAFEQTQVLEGAGIRGGIDFVPQLVVDLASLTPAADRLNLCFQYANWHNQDGHATRDKQPQALLRWSF